MSKITIATIRAVAEEHGLEFEVVRRNQRASAYRVLVVGEHDLTAAEAHAAMLAYVAGFRDGANRAIEDDEALEAINGEAPTAWMERDSRNIREALDAGARAKAECTRARGAAAAARAAGNAAYSRIRLPFVQARRQALRA